MKITTVAVSVLCLCLFTGVLSAKTGIKGIYVFGDSYSDTGNAALYTPTVELAPEQTYPSFAEPYMPGRASNGPVWIEIAAAAYGYEVLPALAGGRNFAFAGAESGTGFSAQGTLNFHAQIRLFKSMLTGRQIKSVHPKDLFVVWFGINDLLRIIESGAPVRGADIEAITANIARGILKLHEDGARMFLVPDMPPLDLMPIVADLGPDSQQFARRMVMAFNKSLESVLRRLGQDKEITILRLSAFRIYVSAYDNDWMYGFENVTDAAISTDPTDPEAPWADYLSWDGLHPTTAGHAIFAQFAMNVIPIGSWWVHSVSRGPDGTAFLGMGWVNDEHWPWLYSYSFKDGGWLWVYDEAGAPEGFLAYVPRGYKWIWVNAQSGWYFDYEAGTWERISADEGN